MASEWVILHGGALGDLALTIQLALRLPHVAESGSLRVVSRVDPGDLSACRPSVQRRSSDGLGLHWLYDECDDQPPERLRDALRGRYVLSALGGPQALVHQRLEALEPTALYSFDPRPQPGSHRHISEQWQTQLETQGLLVPKCVHQRPAQRGLGVPEPLRDRGRALLRQDSDRGDVIVLHPGSGGRAKCWPLAGFVDVARRVRAAGRLGVCFLLGPVEAEMWPPADLAALRGEFSVFDSAEPNDLVAILAGALVYIGNDAGPGHLAALLGTPTVSIFGPTAPHIWRPLSASAQVFAGDPEAQPDNWGISSPEVASAALAI